LLTVGYYTYHAYITGHVSVVWTVHII